MRKKSNLTSFDGRWAALVKYAAIVRYQAYHGSTRQKKRLTDNINRLHHSLLQLILGNLKPARAFDHLVERARQNPPDLIPIRPLGGPGQFLVRAGLFQELQHGCRPGTPGVFRSLLSWK